jgi:hypothetical protein
MVEAYIRNNPGELHSGGPALLWHFRCANDRLLVVNLARLIGRAKSTCLTGCPPMATQKRGSAALNLMHDIFGTATDTWQMVVKISPENTASLKLAESAGLLFAAYSKGQKAR